MSSDKQNPRSPDQQEDTIRGVLKSKGYPWGIVKVYRDDAMSGRYTRNRPGFQQMLTDIRSRAITVDLILVDTQERFGRSQDTGSLRRELHIQHGVLLLSAESNFSDPTTTEGQIFSAFEDLRATGENRVKAHQVLRGKRDLARQGYWPGGKAPFGYSMVIVTEERNGRHQVVGNKLEPNPEEAPIIRKLFRLAESTGYGPARLAKRLNADADIPEKYKPFYDPTVRYWLRHEIYCGDLVWERQSTDIIDDARVVESNPEENWIRVPDFCEPLVDRDQWNAVAALREKRIRKVHHSSSPTDAGKQIRPLAPGLSLKYMLSGLVRCGECHSSMRPVTSGRKRKDGSGYLYYACPIAMVSDRCSNKRHVPEADLREAVIGHLTSRLFSSPD